jgi:hypothetical protein
MAMHIAPASQLHAKPMQRRIFSSVRARGQPLALVAGPLAMSAEQPHHARQKSRFGHSDSMSVKKRKS